MTSELSAILKAVIKLSGEKVDITITKLLKDITESVSAMNMNITSIDMKANEGIATCIIILEVRDTKQLDRLTTRIQKIPSLIGIERI